MNKINLNKILIIAGGFFITLQVHSQNNFAYKATLDGIKETRFYKIDLPPGVVAKCQPGLNDVRIFDESGKQVPYILKNDLPAFNKESLTELPVIQTLEGKDKQTHIILQNITNKPVSNLLLFIKNTDVHRAFSVSGSDDSVHWFIIKESIYLDNSFATSDENIIQTLSFPPSDYKYFQLTILGENLLPFNIVKAGIYNEDVVYGKYVKIPDPGVFQKDSSNKKSYILLDFDDTYQINRLDLEVEGVKYFKRRISIPGSNKADYDLLLNGYLGSDSTNSFVISSKNNQLQVIIDNEDNVPLKVRAVRAFQLNTCLLTYLLVGKKYFLNFGDSTIPAPKYDLQFFSDSIERNPLELSIIGIERNKIVNNVNNSTVTKNNRFVLWTIMVVVFFILCFFTFKMMKEVNRKAGDKQ
ncbi:MAG: hypothetical protein ABI863_04400 [Ginsengibacter sp.]